MGAPGTTEHPPLILSVYSPKEIIGAGNYETFLEYMRTFFQEYGGEFPESKIRKKFGPHIRREMSEVLRDLRQNGFHVAGIDRNGGILWGITTMSKAQRVFESGLQEYYGKSPDELAAMAKTRYRDLVKKQEKHRGSIYKIGNQEGRIVDP